MFSRCLAVGSLSLALVGGAQFYPDRWADRSESLTVRGEDVAAQSGYDGERRQALIDLRCRRDAFAQFLARLGGELTRGETRLGEATERLFYYCLQNYPEHLENVSHAEQGRHIKTRLARSILRGLGAVQFQPDVPPNHGEVLARLEQEVSEVTYDKDPDGRAERQ
jgi:hypothetical protein